MAQRYAGTNLDAMKAIAQAHKNRSLIEFEKALRDYKQGESLSSINMT